MLGQKKPQLCCAVSESVCICVSTGSTTGLGGVIHTFNRAYCYY